MGSVILFTLAAGVVGAMPGGLMVAAHALMAKRNTFAGGAVERTFWFGCGLGLSMAAYSVSAQFGPAFVQVAF